MEPKKTMAQIAEKMPDEAFGKADEEGEEVIETTPTETPENLKTEKVETTTEGQPKEVVPATPPTEPVTPTPFDPIAFIETLSIPEDQKKALREGYLRQADYTRKTQGISTIQSEYNEYKSRGKPILDRIFADPKLLKIVLGLNDDGAPATELPDVPPEDPTEYAQWLEGRIFKKMQVQEEERSKRSIEDEKKQTAWNSRRNDAMEAEKVDSRLTTDEEFQRITAGVVLQDERYLKGEISAVQATREAIAFLDRRIKSAETKAKTDLVNKAKTIKPLIGEDNSPREPVGTKPKNMREALKNAEAKGLI